MRIKIILTTVFTIILCYSEAQMYLSWAKRMGGVANYDEALSATIDSEGNVYTTGCFTGTVDFDPSAGVYNLTSAGSRDVFICKLDANGAFKWAKRMGGADDDIAYSIALDSSGNVYTTGLYNTTADFDPITSSTYNLTSAGLSDIFVSKLDSVGIFVWAKTMGGPDIDVAYSIKIDFMGNVYTTGRFGGVTDFDAGAGVFYPPSYGGTSDIFICKQDSLGDFIWAKSMGSSREDEAYSIVLDIMGNSYITGYFQNVADFDPGVATYNLSAAGGISDKDIFICKLDVSGNFVWAYRIGASNDDIGNSIDIDNFGNIYFTGSFWGVADFNPGTSSENLMSAGFEDIFVCKFDTLGTFIWAKRMGGAGSDFAKSISLDSMGNIYTTGYFDGISDFNPGGGYNLTSSGFSDVFVSKLDSSGMFVSAQKFGGVNSDYGYSIEVNNIENIYVAGYFIGTSDFDPGVGIYNLSSAGSEDAFVFKLANSFTSINEELNSKNLYKFYPNPFKHYAMIEFENLSNENHSLEVYNALGQLIHSINDVTVGQIRIEKGDMTSGLYFFQLNKNGTFVSNGKFIIE